MKHRETHRKAITEKLRFEIWNRFLKGELMEDIGRDLGKDRRTVGYHINETIRLYNNHNMTSAENHIAAELEICHNGELEAWRLYEEAWKAWNDSKGILKTTTETGKALNKKDGGPRQKLILDSRTAEIQVKSENSVGDPRFLKLANDAQDTIREWHVRRCKLLGIDSPKTQINIGGDVNITTARQYIIGELTLIAQRQRESANI